MPVTWCTIHCLWHRHQAVHLLTGTDGIDDRDIFMILQGILDYLQLVTSQMPCTYCHIPFIY